MKLTQEQLEVVKSMIEFAEVFTDQMYTIMVNHGLDKVDGCYFNISIDPSLELTTKHIRVGERDTDFGVLNASRGKHEAKFTPFGNNSAEYELLLAGEELKEKMANVLKKGKHEKQTPPDGLWI